MYTYVPKQFKTHWHTNTEKNCYCVWFAIASTYIYLYSLDEVRSPPWPWRQFLDYVWCVATSVRMANLRWEEEMNCTRRAVRFLPSFFHEQIWTYMNMFNVPVIMIIPETGCLNDRTPKKQRTVMHVDDPNHLIIGPCRRAAKASQWQSWHQANDRS